MTTEEKAKAYDEALEKARKLQDDWKSTQNRAWREIETVFPQLRESEDERIRKYLIEELKAAKSVGELKFTIPQPTREECIAYLEKQKEQKPAEWSEEDERMLSRCVKSIEVSKQFVDSDTFKLAKDKEIVWLENRFKFLSPQPKQELSEEEFETFRKTLAKDAFLDEITSKRVAKKLLNSVKSLRPSWKPSDEQIRPLEYAIDYFKKKKNDVTYLESLYKDLKKLM